LRVEIGPVGASKRKGKFEMGDSIEMDASVRRRATPQRPLNPEDRPKRKIEPLVSRQLDRLRKTGPVVYDRGPFELLDEHRSLVWWLGREWAVTALGIEAHDGECLIEASQLNAVDWVALMVDKPWVDVADFTTAWLVALVLHRVRIK
jgi:hypothetical protein